MELSHIDWESCSAANLHRGMSLHFYFYYYYYYCYCYYYYYYGLGHLWL